MTTTAPPSVSTPASVALGGTGAVDPSHVGAARWPTPRLLQAFLVAIVLAAGVLVLVGEESLLKVRHAVLTLGQDTAPSIIAAQEISSALADLDANAANYLIGNKEHQEAALKVYVERRGKVSERIVDAARNITYEAELPPIRALEEGFGRYLEYAAQARYRYDSGDRDGAVVTYGLATEVMHKTLLPAADALDQANRHQLDLIYEAEHGTNAGAAALLAVAGLLTLGLLGYAQVFLFRHMRRVFNLPLLGATAAAVGITIYLVARVLAAGEDLRVAKEDAFDSIHYLWKARAIAYDANGDESRFLMADAAHKAALDASFNRHVADLTTLPEPTRDDVSNMRRSHVPPGLQGLFGKELNNITFPGELDAATDMAAAFGVYHALDARIRKLERSNDNGSHALAIELCIGTKPDESNAKFDAFDAALLRTIDINHKEFDAKIKEGDETLGRGVVAVPIAAALMALLGFLGLRPRLREYQA
jgi:hypothetical protein